MMTSARNKFNHLYNSFDHGIIKELRCVEKLEPRLAKHKTARIFILRCLQEKVISSSCRIKSKSKNNFEKNIIRKAELQLVNNSIRDYHNKIKHLGNEINVRKNSFKIPLIMILKVHKWNVSYCNPRKKPSNPQEVLKSKN